MAQPVYECTATNSCPGRPTSQGDQDPIHNYMARAQTRCIKHDRDLPQYDLLSRGRGIIRGNADCDTARL